MNNIVSPARSAGWPARCAGWMDWLARPAGAFLSWMPRAARLIRPRPGPLAGLTRGAVLRLTPQHSLHRVIHGKRWWLVGCYPGGLVVLGASGGPRRRRVR